VTVFMGRFISCRELQQQYSEVEVFSEANWVSQDRPRPRPLYPFLPPRISKKKSPSFLFDKQLSVFVLTEQENLAGRS
jgi:hypothetical protein